MRISLLEKRENFYKILHDTLRSNNFPNNKFSSRRYVVNKYLNFIATKDLDKSSFQILINEYSSSLNFWTKIPQAFYVRLATSKIFRSFFSHKIIKMNISFQNYLILGGNHRLRLFSNDLGYSLLLLKKNERSNYIETDVSVRTNQFLTYAPIIYENGQDWIKEEYFNGIPLNRLANNKQIYYWQRKAINSHLDQLIYSTKRICTTREYKNIINSEINTITSSNKLQKIVLTKNKIIAIFDLLFRELSVDHIPISWSHGDFQMANILVRENNFKVIDWESANKRYYLYDLYTLIGGVRSGVQLKKSIEVFRNKISSFLNVEVTNDMIILLFIEELRYSVNEEYSENFYISGLKTKEICDAIQDYLNE